MPAFLRGGAKHLGLRPLGWTRSAGSCTRLVFDQIAGTRDRSDLVAAGVREPGLVGATRLYPLLAAHYLTSPHLAFYCAG